MRGALLWFQIMDFRLLAGRTGSATRHRADSVGSSEWIKARSHDHGENEFVPAVHVRKRVKVCDVHIDLFARLNVSDGLREDIRPLFGEQRGNIPSLFRIPINLLRLLTLANYATDAPLANGHDEFIDGGIV